jgi:hypothetical protein
MKKINMNILLIIFVTFFAGWFLYSWLPVFFVKEPKYEVVKIADGYEIRSYDSYIIAETIVSGAKDRGEAVGKGFSIVSGYIFGNNKKRDKIDMTVPVNTRESDSEKIDMTAPVNTEEVTSETIDMSAPVNTEEGGGSGLYKVSFVMPSSYTLETLPEPNDSRVKIIEVPARKLAVRKFSWSNSESAFKKNETLLLNALKRDGVEILGSINTARYNMPSTIPFMLRNEIQIEVL